MAKWLTEFSNEMSEVKIKPNEEKWTKDTDLHDNKKFDVNLFIYAHHYSYSLQNPQIIVFCLNFISGSVYAMIWYMI